MKEENKMYEYLLKHNYISKNETKSPLRQQELSKERAECIVNKYDSLIKDLQSQLKEKEEVIDKAIEYINENLIISCILDGKKYYTINDYSFDYRELLDILKEVE